MSQPTQKILIVGPSWVGDMVMSQSLYQLLKQRSLNVIIDVLAPSWSHALLERMPEVRQAFAMPVGHGQLQLKQRWQLGKQLRVEKYDQAIVLPNSWKSALVPLAANIPLRTGWRGEWRFGLLNDIRFLDKQRLPLMVQRFVALGLSAAENRTDFLKPYLQVTEQSVATTLARLKLAYPQQPVLVLCPGAEFGPAKRWPAEYFAEVARNKLSAGWQVWILGSVKDQPVAQEIQQLTQNACVNLTGSTALGEAIDLLSLAKLVVTNDSGLMHVAAALQRSIVAIYGSSSPVFTPPLSEQVKILSINLPCSPCFERECPLQHLNCLKQLSPALVLKAMDELV